jgi:DNA polymerase-3 subunit alpha
VLDGHATAEEYAARCNELNIKYLTTTEHGTLTSHRDFQRTAEKNNLTPILGVEAYWTPDRFDRTSKAKRAEGDGIYNHVILLAQNAVGLKNLQYINKDSHLAGYYHKNRTDNTVLQEYSEGVISLSGCLNSPIAKAFEYDNPQKARALAQEFKEIFGDNFYMEVQTHNGIEMNGKLLALADELKIKPVITCDCHTSDPDFQWVQEALLLLNTMPKKASGIEFSKSQRMDFYERMNYLYPDRKMTFEHLELYLKDYVDLRTEMSAQGFDREDIFANTLEIAEKIGDYPYQEGLDLLPRPKNGNPNVILKNKAYEGLAARGISKTNTKYMDRLKRELDVITDKDFGTYFLIVADLIDWAKEQKIPMGFGRGSAAGSLVCYALGITEIDPIPYNLLFERFLDAERDDIVDIDIDIADNRRGEVKEYLERKFKNVGHLMTFSMMDGKSLLKDAARVYSIPLGEVNALTKLFVTWEEYCNSKATEHFRMKYPEVKILGDKLRGRIRTRGVHAGGFVLSSIPLEDVVPIESATNKDDASKDRVPVVAMDKKEAAKVGLVKIDLLGLKNLGVISEVQRLVKDRYNRDFDMYAIKPTDKKVLASITKENASGIFQVDGNAFRNILPDYPVRTFEDIYNLTALIRPGAANSEFGKQYYEFKNKGTRTSIHPDVDWITAKTGGAVLFQEDVMLLCQHLAGMTAGESNKVRKTIGDKDAEALDEWREAFVEGASLKIGKQKAERLWKNIEASADYSFNLSHAVAYSMLTYITAYLKYYYPLEYSLALIKVEKDVAKKIEYLLDAKRRDLTVRMPHVNVSEADLSIKEDYMIFGLTDVKGIGEAGARKIIDKRPFESWEQFTTTADAKYSGIPANAVKALDLVGAAVFKDHPLRGDEADYYYEYLNLPSFDTTAMPMSVTDRLRSVDEYDEEGTFMLMGLAQKIERKNGWARADIIDGTGNVGIFFEPKFEIEKGKFYIFLVHNKSIIEYMELGELDQMQRTMSLYLMTPQFSPFEGYRVMSFLPRQTKAGKFMGTLIVTDDQKNLTGMLVWPREFSKVHTVAQPGTIVDLSIGTKYDNGKETVYLDRIGVM